ncbi:hypothetical protein CPB86DRAFT_783246 [Serendipita vermifera]|nr:hypothetical protein CPB86DRAFT_783246 [Serendipita vermifera]
MNSFWNHLCARSRGREKRVRTKWIIRILKSGRSWSQKDLSDELNLTDISILVQLEAGSLHGSTKGRPKRVRSRAPPVTSLRGRLSLQYWQRSLPSLGIFRFIHLEHRYTGSAIISVPHYLAISLEFKLNGVPPCRVTD